MRLAAYGNPHPISLIVPQHAALRQNRVRSRKGLDIMSDRTLFEEMTRWFAGDLRRINHFIKVTGFACAIADGEGVDAEMRRTVEAVALTHDIGIRISEEKYGSSAGRLQEQEGPAAAREMLEGLGFAAGRTDRICHVIGHHHTYSAIDGLDFQILVEADFLVNLDEDGCSAESIRRVREKIFRTPTGLRLLDNLYAMHVGAQETEPVSGT